MYRLLIATVFLTLANSMPADAQRTCYQGSWELDAVYTFQNGLLGGGGHTTAIANTPACFVMATGSVFLSIDDEGDLAFAFDGWSATFRHYNDGAPTGVEVQINTHGDVFGRYAEASDNALVVFMSGDDMPAPAIESSMVIIAGDQSFEQPFGLFDAWFNTGTSTSMALDYRCEGDFLYVNSESAAGFYKNSRYTRVR